MTWLYFVNFYILQWFWIRLYKQWDTASGEIVSFGLMGFVRPMSGWKEPYIWEKRKFSFTLLRVKKDQVHEDLV